MAVVSPTLVAISESLEAPLAIAKMTALYRAGSRISCLSKFSESSKRLELGFKNISLIFSATLTASAVKPLALVIETYLKQEYQQHV